MNKYVLTSTVYHLKKEVVLYGIAIVCEKDGSYELINEINGISESRASVQGVVDDCNETKPLYGEFLNKIDSIL